MVRHRGDEIAFRDRSSRTKGDDKGLVAASSGAQVRAVPVRDTDVASGTPRQQTAPKPQRKAPRKARVKQRKAQRKGSEPEAKVEWELLLPTLDKDNRFCGFLSSSVIERTVRGSRFRIVNRDGRLLVRPEDGSDSKCLSLFWVSLRVLEAACGIRPCAWIARDGAIACRRRP